MVGALLGISVFSGALFAAAAFAQAIPPTDVSGVAGGGIAGLGTAGFIGWWLTKQHTKERGEFLATIARKDAEIVALGVRYETLHSATLSRFETLDRENRIENRRRDDAWVTVNKDMVAALEHVSTSMDDIRTGMAEMREAMQALAARVADIDGSPPTPTPRPNPRLANKSGTHPKINQPPPHPPE